MSEIDTIHHRALRSDRCCHGAEPLRIRRGRESPTGPREAAAAKPATAAAPVDGGWPRASTTPSGAGLVVYRPQVASWRRR